MASHPVRVTDSTVEPVLPEVARNYLRDPPTEDNELIELLVKAARHFVEDSTGRALFTQTWRLKLDSFEQEPYYCADEDAIRLPRYPLVSVSSITYVDTDGTTQTWTSTEYDVDTDSEPGRILLDYNADWPVTRDEINAVTITWVAGNSTVGAIPETAKLAILYLVAHWYDQREFIATSGAVPQNVPFTVQTLLANCWSGEYT